MAPFICQAMMNLDVCFPICVNPCVFMNAPILGHCTLNN